MPTEPATPHVLQVTLSNIHQPIIIGIAGDSGSGKTRFSNGIRELLGETLVSTIHMDGYHKETRKEREVSKRLPLDPSANNLDLLKTHLESLKRGEPIDLPVYNHESGEFDPPVLFTPTPIIILEGLHALYPEFLPFLDFTIYVDPSRDVKWQWKKNRDMKERGHESKALEEEMLKREAAYKRFIDFQKTSATIVVKIFPSQIKRFARYEFCGVLHPDCYKYELLVEPAKNPLPNTPLPFDLAMITDIDTPPFLLASVPGKYWGRKILTIHIDGELSPATVEALSRHIEGSTGATSTFQKEGYSALDAVTTTRFTQLLIAWRFIEHVSNLVNGKSLIQYTS